VARARERAEEMAGRALRNPAERLLDRLPPGGDRIAHRAADSRLAVDVLARRAAGGTRPLHPDESAGVGGLARASARGLRLDRARRVEALQALRVPRAADDVHDVPLARDAGPLPRFPQ